MENAEAAIARLCDPASEVSAHYLIDRYGETTSIVEEERRAWHAGVGEWRGQDDINSRSIGIELDNLGNHPFPEPQMAALESLLLDICTRRRILPEDIIGHSDMAPGRKNDPGPRFDWARLQRLELAASTGFSPVQKLYQNSFDENDCENFLRDIGYTVDAPVSDKLQAFRDRFLPVSRGAPNGADRAMMLQYLKKYSAPSLCH